jgi:hypothetical protein
MGAAAFTQTVVDVAPFPAMRSILLKFSLRNEQFVCNEEFVLHRRQRFSLHGMQGDQEAQKEVLLVLFNLFEGTPEQASVARTSGLVHDAISLLRSAHEDVRTEAHWIVTSALLSWAPEQAAFFIRCGCMPLLIRCLRLDTTFGKVMRVLQGA